ncbi:MAG: hypothetical protein K0T00_125 [Gaiellaceae bacterium]|nr:hypothetical protein [Gaiellaceae bacterium]
MLPAATPHIRDRVAGSSAAAGPGACASAVEAAIATLGREPGLVLVFPSGDLDPAAVALEAQTTAGEARVAGMTGTAAIGADGPIGMGCSAIAFSATLLAGVGVAEGGDPRAAGSDAAARALASLGDAAHAILLLFVDSEAGDQAEVVAGAYSVAGGTIPLAGGAAGGARRARFADGRALADGVVAVAIGSATPIGVGISHGCIPRGAPSIVTRSDGRTVLQLDGRPAQDVYFEKLGVEGVDIDDEEFELLAMVHPLAEPELSGLLRPRYLRARAPEGGLVCATSIERNAAVEICDQTSDSIVRSARAAAEDAVARLHGPAEAALVFDCAGRSAWLDGTLAGRELEALRAGLGESVPCVAGVYTRGEVGRARGAKGDLNHSVVVAAFSPQD